MIKVNLLDNFPQLTAGVFFCNRRSTVMRSRIITVPKGCISFLPFGWCVTGRIVLTLATDKIRARPSYHAPYEHLQM
ncbi:MAG: hypothetical protein F6K50_36390 [Moorea sp. SIO3I7]|uniref:hypothetical protein n=1 Tax=Moorena TaxID=1155738 RepID=UPI0011EA6A4E|nr:MULTISPECIES: hypothetical protein [Moorena]NEO00722.1 hypothetical protein [Moorena sp. SIO3I7]NEO14882.1 hypothetical protein [Moorena sp. SIO3E8]NEQ00485.1 hypothetical protein [Moorena sp. SIO3F7]